MKAIRWPWVTRARYERDVRAERDAALRAESKAARAEEAAKGRDGRPYAERNEGTITVPVSAVKIAWGIAKDRRDEAFRNREAEAQKDLDALREAGFDQWIPTLAEVREAWHRD